MIKFCGIYAIWTDKKWYVGSSKDIIHSRWVDHRYMLRSNKHPNSHLQSAWNKHGESAFKFSIIQVCPENQLLIEEQKWLTELEKNKDICYNLSFIAGRIQITPEIRSKMSKSHLGQVAWNRGLTKATDDRVRRFSEHKGNASKGRREEYTFVSPNGETVHFKGLRKFCRENDLQHQDMCKVNSGKCKSHKGWTKYNPESSQQLIIDNFAC